MYCLHCGDCCKRMCPFTTEECPQLIQDGTFYFCSVYENRPRECVTHTFPFRFCPIGLSILDLHESHRVAQRIDEGYAKTQTKAWINPIKEDTP